MFFLWVKSTNFYQFYQLRLSVLKACPQIKKGTPLTPSQQKPYNKTVSTIVTKLKFVDLLVIWFKQEIQQHPQIWLHERFFWLWLNNAYPKLIDHVKNNESYCNFLKLKIEYWNATKHPKLFAKLEFEKEIFKLKNQDLFNKQQVDNKVTVKLLPKHKNKHT